ncbi:helix-turn-helix domain-containing protein [Chromobacterium phragmitis]|nr:helix-turn-helix domain-containing protein [Chromobacterium amazonense]
MNLITQAIELVGLQPLAQSCGVTYQAVRKWEKRNRLPRTDWTGETNYAAAIEAVTEGAITKKALLTAVPCAVE